MDWGRYIKELRRSRGIATQAVLAEMVGVDPVTVSRWENGRREPDMIYRQRLMALTKSRDGKADRAIIAAARHAPGAVTLLELGGDVAITASRDLCHLQGLSLDGYLNTRWQNNMSETAQIALGTPVIERMLRQSEILGIALRSRAPSVNGAPYCVNALVSPLWLSGGEMILRLNAKVSPDDQFSGPGIDFIARESA